MKAKTKTRGALSWQLLALIALILAMIFMRNITGALPHVLKAFGGQQATAYVASKHIEQRFSVKFGADYVVEVSFLDKAGDSQYANINVTSDTYKSLANAVPIAIVYNPSKPGQAYALNGQDQPDLFKLLFTITVILVVLAVAERCRTVLWKKVF